ncbi:MAG: hypothetical protein PWQ08_1042 [Clostridiales bacterium]|jgi:catechol 2,3-dioxygenase-like lactoylglutathione lyase family enzyme|nr:hypothetical protein [Clostridiales bacterium]
MTSRPDQRQIVIRTGEPVALAHWLCEELFFETVDEQTVYNEDCSLLLLAGNTTAPRAPAPGTYYTGLAHVALAAADIDSALAHCKARGLPLQTATGGGSFYNPGVFGGGERYFNILTPFGFVLEVAQRVCGPLQKGPAPIAGLDHIGVPCPDFAAELQALAARGFQPLFAPVQNYNEAEGHIACCMVADAALTLEVYQFLDFAPRPMPHHTPLRGIAPYPQTQTPGGLYFMPKGEAE